ncbi:hypoxanthine phosphoribosyltransferase [Candidatus Woesearchaeota archaeon]|nr:hypoxanthine phosphoribosyltransferase [Candidatus Woesearchaeota archaeon]
MPEKINVLLSEQVIKKRVAGLADEILSGSRPELLHVVFVLKGSFVFCADLVRELSRKGQAVNIDYIIAKSYLGTESTGTVKCKIDIDMAGKDILLVEDIVDTGNTMLKLRKKIAEMKPERLRLVTLLDKPERREVDIEPDYVGFEVEDRFLVGYGLDFDERYRELPYIGVISPQ